MTPLSNLGIDFFAGEVDDPFFFDIVGFNRFVAKAEADIAKAKGDIAEIDRKAVAAAGEVKPKLEQQAAALRADLKNAEDKLAAMKHAAAARWREFEGDVSASLAKLKKSLEKTSG